MQISLTRKLLFLFCFLSVSLSGTTYYLDFTSGNDANDGLSPATAWQSFSNISTSNPQPGDEYLFKYGETWATQQLYFTASGSAGNPITIGAYGNPVDGRPILSGLRDIVDAVNAANWSTSGGNIWELSLSYSPARLYLDGAEVLRSSTIATLGIPDNEGVTGEWFYDLNLGILYLFAAQNPATLFSDFKGSPLFLPQIFENVDYLIIENLDFRGGSGASLSIAASRNITIRACNLGHSGNSGILLRDLEINGVRVPCSNISIHDNTFDSNFTFFYGLGSERGCGDGVRLADGVTNIEVYNNTFLNWAHNAIELLGDNPNSSGTSNNEFYDNYITAPDIPYSRAFGADGIAGKCQQNQFYRNLVEDVRTTNQVNGNNNRVHHNIIRRMRNSPSQTRGTAYAFSLGVYGADFVCENNLFDHNLIIDVDEAAFQIRGFGFTNQVQQNAIRNNIIYNPAQAPDDDSPYDPGTAFFIYDTNLDGLGPNTYQNNLFFSSIPTAAFAYDQDVNDHFTSLEFNLRNGIDGNTIANNISGDPLFVDFANQDYHPQANAPSVNAGVTTGIALDYDQMPRFQGAAPDIGPFEFASAPVPVVWGDFTLEIKKNRAIQLKWETYAEENAEAFLVERSKSGINWEQIGEVEALNLSNGYKAYTFLDANPKVGMNYYRLKQLDLDGQFDYSVVISGLVTAANTLTLTWIDKDHLQISSTPQTDWSKLEIHLFSSDGRYLKGQKGDTVFSMLGLSSGVYIIQVSDGRDNFTKSIFKP